MSKQQVLFQTLVAGALLAVGAAQAAPQEVVKLPRVLITGKSAPAAEQQVVQLPRVVVTGLSIQSQLQQQMLAAAKSESKPYRRS
ncbi:hypothetical protein [Roseateles violae]|uniref:Uncharacterized protein n=1 Tax=Roseateles violae TaxID=3058042 RepID=A0ABT8DKG6_9BURK|nr:hypothetical protein [Pelomonas sp. PFR6]MDN3918910.1 hypothetical protein [Pelomonas sp. PFR6]